MPVKPVSVAPIESVKIALVNDVHPALLDRRAEDRGAAGDREQARAVVRRAGGGLAVVLVDERQRHGVTGHEDELDLLLVDDLPGALRVELGLEDRQVAGEEVHQQAGLGAAVHQRAEREGGHPRVVGLLGLVVLLQRLTGVEVDAAAEHAPEVLVAPHDALREAGGAAGVDDVDVVGAALRRSRARRSGPAIASSSVTPPKDEMSSALSGLGDVGEGDERRAAWRAWARTWRRGRRTCARTAARRRRRCRRGS